MHETIAHGCAHGLRDVRSGLLMKKGWRACSTDPEFAAKLGRHCSNASTTACTAPPRTAPLSPRLPTTRP
eukprot:7130823-Pyramimonas_sp.AAC.1